jgi:predicted GNAT family N-acyltransferase
VQDADFRTARCLDDLRKVFVVRGIVFVEEQQTSYALEVDEQEHACVHILGEIDGEPFAAGRIRFTEGWAKMERIAVRKAYRGRGLGGELLLFMLETARQLGARAFKLHAQTPVRAFYEKYGFQVRGDSFLEAGIEHCLMVRLE